MREGRGVSEARVSLSMPGFIELVWWSEIRYNTAASWCEYNLDGWKTLKCLGGVQATFRIHCKALASGKNVPSRSPRTCSYFTGVHHVIACSLPEPGRGGGSVRLLVSPLCDLVSCGFE